MSNKILGYYYFNTTQTAKTLPLLFQISETESYGMIVTFPGCAISYVFLFVNQNDNQVYISGKSANTLKEAMNQTHFADRIQLQSLIIRDIKRSSINFISIDHIDQNINDNYFDPACVLTSAAVHAEEKVRQGVNDGNASIDYTYWNGGDDKPITGSAQIPPAGRRIIVSSTENIVIASLEANATPHDLKTVDPISLSHPI